MITFDRVIARYPLARQQALVGVSLAAQSGALTAVVGPNGSGKTTLIRTLLGRVAITGGSIALDGADVPVLSRGDVARKVAVVVQREEPVFAMTVQEYVALGRYPHLGAWAAIRDDDAAVREAVGAARIGELVHRKTDTLSGGEWQRVRIARALAQDCANMVLDEPTTFLDIAHEMETFELLAALARRGRAVLVVSHQLNLLARFAHHVVLLREGQVAAAGTPDEVMDARTLEGIYGWPLVVARDPAIGAPTLIPLRKR